MAKQVGSMNFWYIDENEDEFNGSVDCSFAVWDKYELGMSIEQYWNYCCRFAAAMGFSQTQINEWFGE